MQTIACIDAVVPGVGNCTYVLDEGIVENKSVSTRIIAGHDQREAGRGDSKSIRTRTTLPPAAG